MERVEVENGKYTVCLPDQPGETLHVLRYGEPWRDCVGDKFIYCMAAELSEARKQLNVRNQSP